MKTRSLALAFAFATFPTLALAQGAASGGHSGHAASAVTASDTAATKAYRAANAKMHRAMDIPFSGDADADFVRGMIPHHQGAIDMAKVALQHGKDEQINKWAADIIREQEREISEMRDWLKKRGL
ncbi:DUF305 domain-containing protein [Microvirga brassicacearum]|uniref:DUF305 domain-containing protein n=2 Tax=Microvirga brassicacearum TaxID=2580413 RepID=A0A5N3PA02_9HYPH|nr:DUF305 domain-containing protein [Microvirga brassicacearum]KAB0266533.1 DUF305 domain-containing protein [Microvirga brassicacearum]